MNDLSTKSLLELRELQLSVQSTIKKMEQQEVIKAREQIHAIAQAVGIPLKDLIASVAHVKAAVAVRFRHPEDATLQWTGRGRQPGWVKEWVTSGKSIDLVRI
jgi:DNA-binding protein H-NS